MHPAIVGLVVAAVGATPASWSRTVAGDVTMVIPFYEGVRVDSAATALAAAGLTRMHMAYPGVLSAPVVAWRSGQGPWEVAYVETLGTAPAELVVSVAGGSVGLQLRSLAGKSIQTAQIAGDLAALAAGLRSRWKVQGSGQKLASRFARVNFYVHQFVSSSRSPPLQMDWALPALVRRMKSESPDSIEFVYGFDPSGVDLAGEYFWSPGAADAVKQVLAANPKLSHLNWLNLRTWKRGIPLLKIERPVTAEVKAMLKVYPSGAKKDDGEYQSKSLDACLASSGWQRSRLQQFERLADLGFKVIQIDEFPIPTFWHPVACQSSQHLHRADDFVDEWAHIDGFLQKLAARARARGVLLTCEEPSAAMLPYVAGYIDRQFNDSIELYRPFRKTPLAAPIPFFSMMFGDLVTPYTDADEARPARRPPPEWLEQGKYYPPRP
jgi:hypothetical protein